MAVLQVCDCRVEGLAVASVACGCTEEWLPSEGSGSGLLRGEKAWLLGDRRTSWEMLGAALGG